MKILLALLGWTLATTATSSSTLTQAATPQRSDPCWFVRFSTEHTIDVVGVGRCACSASMRPRGHGLGTAVPFAHEAREKLISLILHRWGRLGADVEKVDGYNRHLAYVVREDGLFVNAELVRDGLARVSARLRLARLAELKRAEADAQQARRGMWGQAPPVQAPSYTRRRRSNP